MSEQDRTKSGRIDSAAERELSENEEQFRNLAESIGAIPWCLDWADWRFTYVGPQAEDVLGYPASEWLEPDFWNNHIHPEDKDRATKYCLECMANAEDHQLEYRMIAKDGRSVWFHDIASVVNADGKSPSLRGIMIDVTERKNFEKKIGQEEEKYRKTVAAIQDGVYVLKGAEILYMNSACEAIVGRSKKEINKKGWHSLVHPDDSARVEKIAYGRLAGVADLPDCFEFRLIRPDGEVRLVQIRAMLAENYPGGAVAISTMRDVTEQRRTDAALVERERILHHTLENIDEGVIIADRDMIIISTNPAARDIFGYSEAELEGNSIDMLMPKRESKSHNFKIGRYVKSQQSRVIGKDRDLIALRKSGDEFPIERQISDFVSDGKTMYVATIRDISQSRIAESLDQRLGRILDTSAIEIFVVDAASHNLVQVSRGVLDRFGYTDSEILALKLEAILDEKEWRGVLDEFENLADGETGVLFRETQLRHKNGTGFTAELTIHFSGHERPPVFVIIARDLSAEIVAREREKAFDQQINRAQRLHALGQLSAGIAHDLNNILTPILGYALLLTEDLPIDSSAYEDAEQIAVSAAKGRDLVEQIMQFGRSGKGHQLPVDLGLVAQKAAQLLKSSLPDHIAFNLDLPERSPQILGDESQIQQLITNLCSNARHAIGHDKGEIWLTINTIESSEAAAPTIGKIPSKKCARITVEDSGPGIPPGNIESIFEPFFTTRPVGEGTGLGLPVVHGIVRAHSGAVGVESRPDTGTKFHIYLPLENSQAFDSLEPIGALPSRQLSVLIVADEPELSRIIAKILIRAGYEVELAQAGSIALEKLMGPTPSFDLVMIDSTLSDGPVEDIMASIREIAGPLPCIIMTGDNGQTLGSHPPNATIVKPFSPELVRDVVSAQIRDSKKEPRI